MATQNDFSRTFPVNAAMSANRLVAVSSNGSIGLNPIDVPGIGVLQTDVTAGAYENAVVRLFGTGTVRVAVTGAPGTCGNTLYAVTNGLVAVTNATVNGQKVGIALESFTTNGVVIEMLPQVV